MQPEETNSWKSINTHTHTNTDTHTHTHTHTFHLQKLHKSFGSINTLRLIINLYAIINQGINHVGQLFNESGMTKAWLDIKNAIQFE